MSTPPSKSERIHALDSLRAIMMMLGIVIHSAITYGVVDYGASWGIKDPNATHAFFDWLTSYVHAFRMPIFFIVAGFFGALLFYERSPRKMFINRMSRILYPFLVFIMILWPLVQMGFIYSNLVVGSGDTSLANVYSVFIETQGWLPSRTIHLWFLYYLLMFSVVSFGLALLMKRLPEVSAVFNQAYGQLIQRPVLRLLVMLLITFGLLLFMGRPWVATSLSFTPDFNTFIFYFFFYTFGWVLFKSKRYLEDFMKYDWLLTIAGTIVFTIKFNLDPSLPVELFMALNAISVWMFSFGMTGLFMRYASGHSNLMRYVSDSSYWVYLLHLPLTAFIPGLLIDWHVPPAIKFATVALLSLFTCFVTYHYFVRSTFIGKFLNGRKYSRKLKEAGVVPQLQKAAV